MSPKPRLRFRRCRPRVREGERGGGAEAKERVKATKGLTWPEFLKVHVGLGRSRANELIMIGDGRKTVKGLREAGAARMQKSRASTKRPSRDGQSQQDQPEPEYVEPVTNPAALAEIYRDARAQRVGHRIENSLGDD